MIENIRATLTLAAFLVVAGAIQIVICAERVGCYGTGPCECDVSTPNYSPWASPDKIEITCTNTKTMDVRYHEITRQEWEAMSGQVPAVRK